MDKEIDLEKLESLSSDNADRVSTVINIQNPEWGTFKFNYNEQPLTEGRFTHIIGVGPHSRVLDNDEFRFWKVVSFKEKIMDEKPRRNPKMKF